MNFLQKVIEKGSIKIGGVIYLIETAKDRDINFNAGCLNTIERIIRISDKAVNQDSKEDVVIHEIIEAINWMNSLELTHQSISTIGSALYQIIKDNE